MVCTLVYYGSVDGIRTRIVLLERQSSYSNWKTTPNAISNLPGDTTFRSLGWQDVLPSSCANQVVRPGPVLPVMDPAVLCDLAPRPVAAVTRLVDVSLLFKQVVAKEVTTVTVRATIVPHGPVMGDGFAVAGGAGHGLLQHLRGWL